MKPCVRSLSHCTKTAPALKERGSSYGGKQYFLVIAVAVALAVLIARLLLLKNCKVLLVEGHYTSGTATRASGNSASVDAKSVTMQVLESGRGGSSQCMQLSWRGLLPVVQHGT